MKNKKLISFSILFICLIVLCTVCVCAGNTVKFSRDLSKLELNGVEFSRIASKHLYTASYEEFYADHITLHEEYAAFDSISFYTNESENVIHTIINFSDGSTTSAKYLRKDYLAEYEMMLSGELTDCTVDFIYPGDNIVSVDKNDLFSGEKTTLTESYIELAFSYDCFDVDMYNSDQTLCIKVGSIISLDNSYYFVDFNEIPYYNTDQYFSPESYDTIPAYKVTDEEVLASLEEAESLYLGDGLGFLEDGDLINIFANIFFVIVFGILPLAVAVVFLILALRSKGIYKKLYAAVCILAILTSVIFTILSILAN